MTRKLLRGLLFLFAFTAVINATDLRPVLLLTPSAEISPPLETNFDVEVENENVLMANSFTVRFTLLDPDGNTVFTEDVQGMNLPPFSKDNYATSGTYNFTETGVYTLVVNVIFSEEIDPSDNEKEYTITVTETCPGPPANFSPANGAEVNLSASNNGGFANSVELSWQNPGNQTDVKVFFGTDETAVGSASDELLLTGGASLSSTNVEPDFFGQTYYWMVQEICVQGEETFTNNGPVNSFVMVNTPIITIPQGPDVTIFAPDRELIIEWENPPGQDNVNIFGAPSPGNLFDGSNFLDGGPGLNSTAITIMEEGEYFIGFESTYGGTNVQSSPHVFDITIVPECGIAVVDSPGTGSLIPLENTNKTMLAWENPDEVLGNTVFFSTDSGSVSNMNESTIIHSNGTIEQVEVTLMPNTDYYWLIGVECGSGLITGDLNTFTTGDLPGTLIEPGEGVEFSQIDFDFANQEQPGENSSTGLAAVNAEQVAEEANMPQGYLNVYANNGWVIQNFVVDPAAGYEGLSSFFPLTDSVGADVTKFNALVLASDEPITDAKDFGPVTIFDVDAKVYNAEGRNTSITKFPSPVTKTDIPFNENGETEFVWQKGHVNIEQGTNQCGPASVANSLQWLENEQEIEVPHEYKKGYRDTSLVGQLDIASQRTNHNAVGDVNMLKGKIKYVDDNNLSDDLTLKHKNRKGATFVPNDTVKQGNYYSVANTDTTSLIDWIIQELKDGEDVELGIGWSGGGGHWVDLIGGGYVKGVPWIAWVHDTNQGHDDMGTATTTDDTVKVNGGIDYKSGGFNFSYIVNNKLASVSNGDTSIGTIDLAFSESKKEVTSVSEEYTRGLKTEYALSQNYPNPFNPTTTIEYSIQNSGYVRITIYDILGKEVDVLVDGFKQVGSYKISYDARNITSGVYFYTMQIDNTYITKKFILMK